MEALKRCYRAWIAALGYAQPPFLLAIRVVIGWGFLLAGWGKLTNVAETAAFFKSSGITFLPELNVYLAGTAETVGGALLLLGAAARVATLPLVATMVVALATAHKDIFDDLVSDPNGFVKAFAAAPPLPYLITALAVLLFGPGGFSVDGLIQRLVFDPKRPPEAGRGSAAVLQNTSSARSGL